MAGVVVVSPVVVSDGYGNLINIDHSGNLKVTASISEISSDTMVTINPGSTVISGVPFPSDDPTLLARDFLRNAGSANMNVDGSVTPKIFSFDADAYMDISVYEVRTVFSDNGLPFGDNKFGSGSNLSNGLLYEIYFNSIATTLANMQINDDFMFLTPGPTIHTELGGATDILMAVQQFGSPIKLRGGTTDAFRVTVRDNLAAMNALRVLVYGIKG